MCVLSGGSHQTAAEPVGSRQRPCDPQNINYLVFGPLKKKLCDAWSKA